MHFECAASAYSISSRRFDRAAFPAAIRRTHLGAGHGDVGEEVHEVRIPSRLTRALMIVVVMRGGGAGEEGAAEHEGGAEELQGGEARAEVEGRGQHGDWDERLVQEGLHLACWVGCDAVGALDKVYAVADPCLRIDHPS